MRKASLNFMLPEFRTLLTINNWKSKYGGMNASQLKRLKELEEENRKLKQMYAEVSIQRDALKDFIEK